MKNISINTLLYLVLAAVVIGGIIAYLSNSFTRENQTQSERLRPQVFEHSQPTQTSRQNNPTTPLPETDTENESDKEVFCAQVITPARNPDTNEIEEFPTPCDVPDGWEILTE